MKCSINLLYMFVAFMPFFFSICAIPHLVCRCLSISYVRQPFLCLRHVCLSCVTSILSFDSNMSHFDGVRPFWLICISFSSSHLPSPPSVTPPSFRSSLMFPHCHSLMFQFHRWMCTISHRSVSWTFSVKSFFLFFNDLVINRVFIVCQEENKIELFSYPIAL